MDHEPEGREPDDSDERGGVDRHLAVILGESTLWPVLVAAFLIFATGGAALFLLALGDRNLFAVAALLVLVWMSVDVLVRRRRFGLLGGFIVTFWLLSGLAAGVFLAFGLF